MKKQLTVIFVLLCAFVFVGCNSKNDTIIYDNKDELFIIDLDGSLNKDFFDCEIVEELKEESDKEYKFIIVNEVYTDLLNNYDKINELEQKITDGYIAIYPQSDRQKANNFIGIIGGRQITEDEFLRGVVLKRAMNFSTNSYYIQTIPSFVSHNDTDALQFIKSEIETAIKLKKENSEIFQGVYISKAEYVNHDFEELTPFNEKTNFDRLGNSNFTIITDEVNKKIFYSIQYEISEAQLQYFYPYVIVKENNSLKAVPLSNSCLVHSGVKHTLTKEKSIFTNIDFNTETYEQEYVKITFIFI